MVSLLESKMGTFLPEEGFDEGTNYLDIPSQDLDFVDYWWGLLFRQLQGSNRSTPAASKGPATRPTQTDTLDEEDLNLAADELDLMRELERPEKSLRPPEEMADKEFKAYQDKWLRERDAALTGTGRGGKWTENYKHPTIELDKGKYESGYKEGLCGRLRAGRLQLPGHLAVQDRLSLWSGQWTKASVCS